MTDSSSNESDGPPRIPDDAPGASGPRLNTLGARGNPRRASSSVHSTSHNIRPRSDLRGRLRPERRASDQTSHCPTERSAGNSHTTLPQVKDGGMQIGVDTDKLLVARPSSIEFKVDYDGCRGGSCSRMWRELTLQNSGCDVINFAVMPPTSSAYSIDYVSKSTLPPGMSQHIKVFFNPCREDEQSDYIRIMYSRKYPDKQCASGRLINSRSKNGGQPPLHQILVPLNAATAIHGGSIWKDSSKDQLHAVEDTDFDDDFIPKALDFGSVRVSSNLQRRLVLPGAVDKPVHFQVQIKGGPNVFSVKPEQGVIAPGKSFLLWVSFYPALHATYSQELYIFFGASRYPHKVGLLGVGVPIDTWMKTHHDTESQGIASMQCVVEKEMPVRCIRMASRPLDDSSPKASRTGCSKSNGGHMHRFQKNTGVPCVFEECPEREANTSGCESTEYVDDIDRTDDPTKDDVRHEKREHPVQLPGSPVSSSCSGSTKTNLSKTSCRYGIKQTQLQLRRSPDDDSQRNCREAPHLREPFERKWAEMVASQRTQEMSNHCFSGSTLPSAAMQQRLQQRRHHDIQSRVKERQIQDRCRSAPSFVGRPIKDDRPARHLNKMNNEDLLRDKSAIEQWRLELYSRLRAATSRLMIISRASKRLALLRAVIRHPSVFQPGSTDPVSETHRQQPARPTIDAGTVSSRTVNQYPTSSPNPRASVPLASRPFEPPEYECLSFAFDSLEETDGLHFIADSGRSFDFSHFVLDAPRLFGAVEGTGDLEGEITPGLHLWGIEVQRVGVVYGCLQTETSIQTAPRSDAEILRLREVPDVSFTGGLETSDVDFFEALMKATPALISDVHGRETEEQAIHKEQIASLAMNQEQDNTFAKCCISKPTTLLPKEEREAARKKASDLVAPDHPSLQPLMMQPRLIESDLAWPFFQVRRRFLRIHVH